MGKYDEQYRKIRQKIARQKRELEKRGYFFESEIIPKPLNQTKVTKRQIEKLLKLTLEDVYRQAKYRTNTGEIISGLQRRQQEKTERGLKLTLARLEKQSQQSFGKKKDLQEKIKKLRERIHGGRIGKGVAPAADVILHKMFNFVRQQIDEWKPEEHWSDWFAELKQHDKSQLARIFESAITQYGKEAVASRLEDNAETVTRLVDEILYGSDRDSAARVSNGRIQVSSHRMEVSQSLAYFAAILKGESLTRDEAIQLAEEEDIFEYEDDSEIGQSYSMPSHQSSENNKAASILQTMRESIGNFASESVARYVTEIYSQLYEYDGVKGEEFMPNETLNKIKSNLYVIDSILENLKTANSLRDAIDDINKLRSILE